LSFQTREQARKEQRREEQKGRGMNKDRTEEKSAKVGPLLEHQALKRMGERSYSSIIVHFGTR
jgi:hypothetical protein